MMNPDDVSAGPVPSEAPTPTPVATSAPGFTRPAGAYRINGRWKDGAFYLVGPTQDFLDVGAILTAIGNGTPDGNGNVSVTFDGEGQPPIKQAGN